MSHQKILEGRPTRAMRPLMNESRLENTLCLARVGVLDERPAETNPTRLGASSQNVLHKKLIVADTS